MRLTKELMAIFASAENLPTSTSLAYAAVGVGDADFGVGAYADVEPGETDVGLVLVLTLDHDQKSERAGLNIWHSLAPQVLNRGGWATFAVG